MKSFINFNFFLPEAILKDSSLGATDRLVIGVIIKLDNKRGCFASNKTIGGIVGCNAGTVSKSINKLCRLGYIVYNEPCKTDGGRIYIRRVSCELKKHKAG